MKAALMAAVMAFVPGAALAHPNHYPHHHYDHDHTTVIVEERDRTGDAAVILGGALVLGGLLINSQEPRVTRRTEIYRPYRHHHHRHVVVVDEYYDHGRRYRVCQRGHKTFYC